MSGHTSLNPTKRTVHLCIDMQRIFSSEGPWATPWMERVLPVVTEIASRFPERTVFTRFITPERPEDMPGTWRPYYEKWRETTRERLDPQMLGLMPSLARLAPPAAVIDKNSLFLFRRHLPAHSSPAPRRGRPHRHRLRN